MTYALGGNAQTTAVFQAKFNWDKDEAILYNTIISSAGVVGAAIGCFLGSILLKLGRRNTLIISQMGGILAAGISMITHVATLSIGRLILGTAGGVMCVVFGKNVTETIPPQWVSSFAMSLNAAVCIGFVVCYGLGALLPDAEDVEANKETEMWRVIWLMPAAIGIVVICFTLFIYKLEPIGYCLMEGRD